MSTLRTVKLSNHRPGEPIDETKTIKGVTIERGIPMPPPRGSDLVAVLLALDVGESFLFKHQASTARASEKMKGRTFAARRQPDGRFRIWRLE
jgi:hypothetical protein